MDKPLDRQEWNHSMGDTQAELTNPQRFSGGPALSGLYRGQRKVRQGREELAVCSRCRASGGSQEHPG